MGILRITPAFAAFSALAALAAGPAPVAPSAPAAVAVGDLACIEADSLPVGRSAAPAVLPKQCPVLVVGVEARTGRVRLLGGDPWDYRLPAGWVRPLAKANLPGILRGATDRTLSRMAPSPNPGVLKSAESFGLLIGREGRMDTLALDEWPNLHRAALTCRDLAACLDSLRTSPLRGLLQGPFLPRISFEVRPGDIPTYEQGRHGKAPQAGGTATLLALARPRPGSSVEDPGGTGKTWTWALASFPADRDSLRRAWVWSAGRGQAKVLRVPPGDPFEVRSVEARDLDRDGHPDLLAETVSYHGDGTYADLHVFHGHPDSARPGYAVLSLAGSSGEPGGSDVAGDWWAAPPRLYRAFAAKGNDQAPEATHDLRIEAYDYSRGGSLAPTRAKTIPVTVFGTPGGRSAADSLAKLLSAGSAEAGKGERIEVRPLPRLVAGRLLWQAGAIAPDAATAERWARRDKSARVLRIPAGPAGTKHKEGWNP